MKWAIARTMREESWWSLAECSLQSPRILCGFFLVGLGLLYDRSAVPVAYLLVLVSDWWRVFEKIVLAVNTWRGGSFDFHLKILRNLFYSVVIILVNLNKLTVWIQQVTSIFLVFLKVREWQDAWDDGERKGSENQGFSQSGILSSITELHLFYSSLFLFF